MEIQKPRTSDAIRLSAAQQMRTRAPGAGTQHRNPSFPKLACASDVFQSQVGFAMANATRSKDLRETGSRRRANQNSTRSRRVSKSDPISVQTAMRVPRICSEDPTEGMHAG